MKKNILYIVTVFLSAMLLASCSSYREIRMESCRLVRMTPHGLKSVEIGLLADITNPARDIIVKDVEGVIYRKGQIAATVEAGPAVIEGRGRHDVHINARLSLSPVFRITDLLAIVSDFRPEEFTIDLSAKVKIKGGAARKVRLEGIPVKDILKRAHYENI